MPLYIKNSSFLCYTLLLFLVLNHASAQIKTATLGINGLTCSLCSYGVEKELDKLDCISSVQMDLNKNIATIVFNTDVAVDMKAVIDAVYKAGFSVGYTQALCNFDNIHLENYASFTYNDVLYIFMEPVKETLKGEHIIKFIDRKFVVDTVFKEWKDKIKSIDKTMLLSKNTIVYHITL